MGFWSYAREEKLRFEVFISKLEKIISEPEKANTPLLEKETVVLQALQNTFPNQLASIDQFKTSDSFLNENQLQPVINEVNNLLSEHSNTLDDNSKASFQKKALTEKYQEIAKVNGDLKYKLLRIASKLSHTDKNLYPYYDDIFIIVDRALYGEPEYKKNGRAVLAACSGWVWRFISVAAVTTLTLLSFAFIAAGPEQVFAALGSYSLNAFLTALEEIALASTGTIIGAVATACITAIFSAAVISSIEHAIALPIMKLTDGTFAAFERLSKAEPTIAK